MKCAFLFVCALLSIPLSVAIRTEGDGMEEGGMEGFVKVAEGKWCPHSTAESAGVSDEGYNLEKCRTACADETSCAFFCFDSEADWCSTYKTCDDPTDKPNDFEQETSGWTIYKKAAEQDAAVLDKNEQELHDGIDRGAELHDEHDVQEFHDEVELQNPSVMDGNEVPECNCAQDKYQKGSLAGDTMCAFQGNKNCALSKGSCPANAVTCRKPVFEATEDTIQSPGSELPTCTCPQDKYQKGSLAGDTMCAFQGGKNCALSKGSCPAKAVACRKPVFEAAEDEIESPGSDLPTCTCPQDKYQKGSVSGDVMCAFQGGKNCALSKGSCPEGRAVACKKP